MLHIPYLMNGTDSSNRMGLFKRIQLTYLEISNAKQVYNQGVYGRQGKLENLVCQYSCLNIKALKLLIETSRVKRL
jgi:hypothetical protein